MFSCHLVGQHLVDLYSS